MPEAVGYECYGPQSFYFILFYHLNGKSFLSLAQKPNTNVFFF